METYPFLNHLSLSGYKSIRSLDLYIQPLNILIGANGAGKSNLLSLFKFLRHLATSQLAIHVARSGGAESFLHLSQAQADNLEIYLDFGQQGYACTLAPAASDLFFFEQEVLHHQRAAESLSLGQGHSESLLPSLVNGSSQTNGLIASLQSGRVYHFQDTSDRAKIKKTVSLQDNLALHEDGANLAAYLYLLYQTYPVHYQRILKIIRLANPFFANFVLRPDPLNPETIRLAWQQQGVDATLPADRLADGTLRFMCLVTLLCQPDLPALIVLDEPELGLHPYALNLLADLLEQASQRAQLLIATQSAALINQVAPNSILVVEHDGQESTFQRLQADTLDHWLDQYALGELWEKNIIGGRP